MTGQRIDFSVQWSRSRVGSVCHTHPCTSLLFLLVFLLQNTPTLVCSKVAKMCQTGLFVSLTQFMFPNISVPVYVVTPIITMVTAVGVTDPSAAKQTDSG